VIFFGRAFQWGLLDDAGVDETMARGRMGRRNAVVLIGQASREGGRVRGGKRWRERKVGPIEKVGTTIGSGGGRAITRVQASALEVGFVSNRTIIEFDL
jgi:hypothetical protein